MDDAGAAGPSGHRRTAVLVTAALASLTAVSVALRLEGLGIGFWVDEGLSVGIAQSDAGAILGHLAGDGSPPLYYLLLGAWVRAFGSSETATHALSLLFATVTVPVAFWAALVFGRRAAWLAAVLAATSPFITYFARETRMYSLVTLLALVVAATFVRAFVYDRPRAAIGFVATLVLTLLTHNWGLYLGLAAAVAMVPALLAAERPQELARRAGWAFGAVAVLYLPWVPVLVGQISSTGAPWSYTPGVRDLVRETAALVRDERVLVALVLAAGSGAVGLLRRPRTPDGAAAWALSILVIGPILMGWLVAQVEPSWATRYLAVSVGPMLLALGWWLSRAGALGLVAAAIAVVLWIQPFTRVGPGLEIADHMKSNAGGLAAALETVLGPDDLVIVGQPEALPLFALYLGEDLAYASVLGPTDEPLVMDWRDVTERLSATTAAEYAGPLVAGRPPGSRIALVVPSTSPAPTDTDWIRLFRARSREWRVALASDSRLATVPFGYTVPLRPLPTSAFTAQVFEVVGVGDETN
jgi:mannosyltransferase